MELTKLIEQYERENPGEKAFSGEFGWREKFVLWLASRPTCGVEARKFLNEVEELNANQVERLYEVVCFASDLSKVIKGE